MLRVWILIIFASLSGLLTRTASAQSELSFLVNEETFESLVVELELQGEMLEDARALWGPYYFNLTQGYETYVDFTRWPRMGMHPALTQYFRTIDYSKGRPEWDRRMLERSRSRDRLFKLDQRRLTWEFFDELRELVPYRMGIVDSYQRAVNRRALLHPGWNLTGGHVDLVHIMKGLSRAYPDTALARSHWTDEVRSILDSYERTMDNSLLDRDRVVLARSGFENSPPKPEDPEELRELWDRDARESAAYTSYYSHMRKFNQDSARKLAAALSEEESALFLERANLLISPFAYKKQGWQLWIEQALKLDDLDDEQRETLLAMEVTHDRERDRYIRDLVRLYDFRGSPEQILERNRRNNEISQNLRSPTERTTEAELAYDEAEDEYENFNKIITAKIRSLLGERSEKIAGIVLVKLEAQEEETDDSRMSEFTRERIEQEWESSRPRYELPFINASEFKQCVEKLAFDDDKRKAIFESLYDDFHAGFVSALENFENDRRIAEEKDIRDNPDRPTRLSSGQRNPFPNINLMLEWKQRWIMLRQRLELDFAEQVRLFLSEKELHDWNQELRRLRRFRMIPTIKVDPNVRQGRYVYDLLVIVEELDLIPLEKESFQILMHDYEMAIDAECYRFESEYDALMTEMFALSAARTEPPSDKFKARSERVYNTFRELLEAVPNLRHHYVPLIADALDADERQRFLEAIDKQEYPWLYLESPADMLKAALRRDNVLDAELSLALDEQEKQLDYTRKEFRRQYLGFMRRYDKEKDDDRRLELMEDIFRMALRRSNIDHEACGDIMRLIPPHQREELALDIRLLLETVP